MAEFNGRIQWQAIVGIIFFILLIFSDIFHLRFISFYTGVGMNDHVNGLLGRLMNGSKFSFGVAAWLLCVGEVYIYYLMVIAMYVATLRAKNIFFALPSTNRRYDGLLSKDMLHPNSF